MPSSGLVRRVLRLLVTAKVVPHSPTLVTLMMEAIPSSETSVLTRVTRCNIPEDGILHSHRRKHLKSYTALTGWALLRRRNVFPVRYELSFYIPEDGIIHSQRRENPQWYSSGSVHKVGSPISIQLHALIKYVSNTVHSYNGCNGSTNVINDESEMCGTLFTGVVMREPIPTCKVV
jgi:hypothetical protein